ncbi:MAG: hypothetical protein AAF529_16575 [Pseudomonadota bacterium]
MPLYTRVGGTWRLVANPTVRVGGQNRQFIGRVNVGGTWRMFHAPVGLTDSQIVRIAIVNPNPTIARANFRSNGNIDDNGSIGINSGSNIDPRWFDGGTLAGIGNSFQIRFTLQTGTLDSSSGLGTWLSLSSDRFIELQHNGVPAKVATVLVEVRPTGGTVLDSAIFTLSAEVSPL